MPLFHLVTPAVLLGFGSTSSFADLLERKVPNQLTTSAALIGLTLRIASLFFGAATFSAFFCGLMWPAGVFLVLYVCWTIGLIGAGDVKLATSFSFVLPSAASTQLEFLLGSALLGGCLAVVYLPSIIPAHSKAIPVKPAPRNASLFSRLIRIEIWRARHGVGLPYAIPISVAACGAALHHMI